MQIFKSKSRLFNLVIAITIPIAAVAAVGVGVVLAGTPTFQGSKLKEAVQDHFPNTPISSVTCKNGPAGLCEVVAGANIFYVTPDAKFALVGSVLDLDKKLDLTDQRLRQLAAIGQAEAKIKGQGPQTAPGPQAQAAPAAKPAESAILRVTLPKSNAVIHNLGAPLKMTIFTDLNCSYCKRLHEDLKSQRDIEVTEYPIAFLAADSAQKAKLALCAKDRVAGVDALYSGGEVVTSGDCAAAQKALDANIAFAHQNNINGTPMIVRPDGVTNSGWLPTAELRAFLSASQNPSQNPTQNPTMGTGK
jgi:thiol:disulfide interchange protein DsbC